MEIAKDAESGQEICVICTTVPTDQSAAIAEKLLGSNLVACVNIMPVRSLYRWKGQSCDDDEHLLIIKTRRGLSEVVIRAIRMVHPYEVPEIIVLPVIAGHAPYIAWVYGETEGS
ncbi:MAG: divalent-cation tolerance protein CutA [Methanoregula sp.]|nr:divalent-cation tolerance protein CutA [Methanoregula sp.]